MIGCEHDCAHTVIPVKEFIGIDKVLPGWCRKRVAPVQKFSLQTAVGENGVATYCFARLSLTMATGPSNVTRMFFQPWAL